MAKEAIEGYLTTVRDRGWKQPSIRHAQRAATTRRGPAHDPRTPHVIESAMWLESTSRRDTLVRRRTSTNLLSRRFVVLIR
jgi:hypothetical protein